MAKISVNITPHCPSKAHPQLSKPISTLTLNTISIQRLQYRVGDCVRVHCAGTRKDAAFSQITTKSGALGAATGGLVPLAAALLLAVALVHWAPATEHWPAPFRPAPALDRIDPRPPLKHLNYPLLHSSRVSLLFCNLSLWVTSFSKLVELLIKWVNSLRLDRRASQICASMILISQSFIAPTDQGRSQVFIGGGARWGNINLSIKTFLQNREKLYC